MLTLRTAFAVLALIFASVTSAAAAPSGTALGVDPDAEARGTETRTLVVGSDIFLGDRVVTGASGLVQIKFSDDTKLVVGPRSSLLIEDYLLRDDGSAGRLAVNMLSGSFRFITGRAAKDRYVIKTPTGTIGVRGTAMNIYVEDLFAYIMQLHGSSFECPDATPTQCEVLDTICGLAIMGDSEIQIIGHTDEISGADREALKDMFSFDNADLLREFRVAAADRCLNRPATGGGGGDSLSEGGQENAPQGQPQTPPSILRLF